MTGNLPNSGGPGCNAASTTDAPGYEEHNAEVRRQARFDEIGRSLAGAIEQAAGQLSELGLTGDEVGEFIQSTWECSDWSESLHIDGCTLPGDHEGACDA